MNGFVANTDHDWYSFLRRRPDLDEINFWMPKDTRHFRAIPPGAPLLFKLKAAHGHPIVGFATFVRWSALPAWLAWDTFGQGNGAASFEEMTRRIWHYRGGARDPLGKFEIGCLLLMQPVFFGEDEWIRPPSDWSRTIVQGKSYDLGAGEGQRIWTECLARAADRHAEVALAADAPVEVPAGRGAPVLVQPRLGQGAFRIAVIDAYRRACAVSTEHSLPVLEAAHIRDFAETEDNRIENGICLRADIHRLFDRGYVTITPEHRFEVSRRLREDYENGRVYYGYSGQSIMLPADRRHWPSGEALRWHNEHRFVA